MIVLILAHPKFQTFREKNYQCSSIVKIIYNKFQLQKFLELIFIGKLINFGGKSKRNYLTIKLFAMFFSTISY